MADNIGQNIRNMVIKGFEAIENTASSLATSTKQKVDEFNLQGKRKDAICALGAKAYDLWASGTAFPDELTDELQEVHSITEQLASIHSAYENDAAEGNGKDAADDNPPAQEEPTAEPCSSDASEHGVPAAETDEQSTDAVPDTEKTGNEEIPVIEFPESQSGQDRKDSPLSSAINDLFEQIPPVDKMADKVNSTLDEMGDNLRRFSSDIGKQISDMADDLMGKKDKKD